MNFSSKRNKSCLTIRLGQISEFLVYFYFALAFFEPYLNGVFGSVTKYYILFLSFFLVYQNKWKIARKSHIMLFVIWLMYRFITLLWTENFRMFHQHVLSQIGMVMLLVALTSYKFNRKELNNIVKAMWLSSLIIAFLTIRFGQAYHGTIKERQVLVLFGQAVDPNNQAVFLLIGISIAIYYLFYEKKCLVLSFVTVFVNAIAMFRTGSRGGFVSLIAILLFVMVFHEKRDNYLSKIRKVVGFTAIVLCFFYVFQKYVPQDILYRLFNVSGYEGGSERTVIWMNALELLCEDLNIVFGAGWGDYFGYNGFYKAMHNTYLAMLCDVGIIGFVIFFAPIIQTVIYCIKSKEYLPVMILMSAFLPSFFLEAINKRFFWNAIMFLFIFVYNYTRGENEESYEANFIDK